MKTKEQLTQHTAQIGRLEQVMTALAEAQVKSEDDSREMKRAITKMARSITELKAEVSTLTHQWQAYINTLPRQ